MYDNHLNITVSNVLSNTPFGVIVRPMALSAFNFLQRYNYAEQQVVKNFNVMLYCGSFSKYQLANSRTPRYWSPDDIQIDTNGSVKLFPSLHVLPLIGSVPTAIDLLPGSNISLYTCISAPVDGKIYFRLYRYHDVPDLSPNTIALESKLIAFNELGCANTSITVSDMNLVVPALARNTSSVPEFTKIYGYVMQFHYDEKYLGLIDESYLIKDKQKTVSGNETSEIVCYAAGKNFTIFSQLVNVVIPVAWSELLCLPISLLAVVVFVFCLCCLFKGRVFLRKLICKCCPCSSQSGYDQLP